MQVIKRIILPSNIPWVGPLIFVTCFIFILYSQYVPHWETDDVAISMMTHGYGIAVQGSPTVLFSNIIWPSLIRLLPQINGMLGYSIATITALILVSASLCFGLIRLGSGLIISAAISILLMTKPLLFPQFTITSGLLMVSAIVLWHVYANEKNLWILGLSILCAYFSYLIRSQEFFVVLLISLPILPWKVLIDELAPKIGLICLFIAIAISAIYDRHHYKGFEWNSFNNLNMPRAAFTDFGMGKPLKARPDIYEKYNYSRNDIELLESWFFEDTHIADPIKMTAMLSELGSSPSDILSIDKALNSLNSLFHPALLSALLSGIIAMFLWPSWRIFVSWMLCLAVLFTLGLLGRPSVIRVYVPLVSLLCIAPFLISFINSGWRAYLIKAVILLAVLFNSHYIFAKSNYTRALLKKNQDLLVNLPETPVMWGAAVPLQSIYPVFGTPDRLMRQRYYALGTSTYSPYSVATFEKENGRGMITQLLSAEGVDIFASDNLVTLLRNYCFEHHQGVLVVSNEKIFEHIKLINCRCDTKVVEHHGGVS